MCQSRRAGDEQVAALRWNAHLSSVRALAQQHQMTLQLPFHADKVVFDVLIVAS